MVDVNTHVRKRDGRTLPFDDKRIRRAIERAYRADLNIDEPADLPIKVELRIDSVRDTVLSGLDVSSLLSVEHIQNKVEEAIAAIGDFDVARKYILYRESRARTRVDDNVYLQHANGSIIPISYTGVCDRIRATGAHDQIDTIAREVLGSLRYGSAIEDLDRAITFALRSRIALYPEYAYYAAQSLLRSMIIKVTGRNAAPEDIPAVYKQVFIDGITKGIAEGLYDDRLASTFDVSRLAETIDSSRDKLFKYLGMQTVVDRYLLRDRSGAIFELPQTFWMRVAMGLAILEDNPTERAIEFYRLLSSMDAISSTPTLFNAGTTFPQLSSCYGTTTQDDLSHIFKTFQDHAQLSKWSGGIGADWTNVRSLGAPIRQTNGKSQGVVPFLKLQNDTAVAVDQSGKRKGAIAAYMESWHADFEEFLDLRKNTGDERRRTHDLNLAAWVPDLFMQRVYENGDWWLFNPSDVPDLHDAYGIDFELRYKEYEKLAESGVFPLAKKREAVTIWRGILGSLYETGYPWVTFKDAMNLRNPQNHDGVIHNSNLCVVGSTRILTQEHGYVPIETVVDTDLHVWNGTEWSLTTPRITGHDREVFTISLSNGAEITVTPNHKFPIEGVDELVAASDLKIGDRLKKFSMPIIDSGVEIPIDVAYTQGVYAGDGFWDNKRNSAMIYLYHDKQELESSIKYSYKYEDAKRKRVLYKFDEAVEKTFVPFNWSLASRKAWLAGLIDTDGTKAATSIQIASVDKDFLDNTRLMLTTMGVQAKVTKGRDAEERLLPNGHGGYALYETKDLYRLLISSKDAELLSDIPTNRISVGSVKTQRDARHFVRIEQIKYAGKVETTYCFTEPIKNLGTFEGVVLGNCTEIGLNNSADEHFVCNLLSVNLANHVTNDGIDETRLENTITTSMRMLDNVIDVNYYPTQEARTSNLRHRPVGLGLMGFQDALWAQGIGYASPKAVQFADMSMEYIAYFAIKASTQLASERGAYPSYEGSDWSQGILPIDTVDRLADSREMGTKQDRTRLLDWDALRTRILRDGMRNSNTMAIAPTATISNIAGVTQSIEPMFSNIFVKSNLSGEFTLVNEYLIEDLKKANLWNKDMLEVIKFHDGSIARINEIPAEIRQKYPTAFEVQYQWLIEAASRRQKWIDQAQSLNLYIIEPSGKQLDEMYKMAWAYGLKTTYYLRSRRASQGEKVTVNENKFGILDKWQPVEVQSVKVPEVSQVAEYFTSNMTTDYDEFYCESCQ